MSRRFLFFALSLLVALSRSAAADTADPVSVGPMPDWADRIPLPDDDDNAPTQLPVGTRYLLIDHQVHHGDPGVEAFAHVAKKIVSHQGVQEGAELSFDVDPSYQQLILHTIQIHRGTNILNRLDRSNMKVLQRERDLERQIYDGALSVVQFLEDVRVGDVIEYSYTLRGTNPVFDDHYVDAIATQWQVPVGRNRVRVLWPSNRTLQIKPHGSTLTPSIRKVGDQTEYVWDEMHVPAIVSEGDLPTWYQPFAWLQLSEFTDWGDVARWSNHLNRRPATLSTELQEKVNEWRAQSSDKEDQVLAALEFVEDDIRYLGIELGASSHAPADPNVVAQRRFGDCKDKTLLLCSLLDALGIESHPALVSTWAQQTVEDWLPSPLCFNHTIAQVSVGGKTYWIDPTRSHQRGRLRDFYVPEYGAALVVRDDTEKLSKVTGSLLAEPIVEVYEHYDARSLTNPVTLRIETVRHGLEAEQMRFYYTQVTQDQLDKELSNYHARWFPQLILQGHVQIHDDTAHNILKTVQDYQVPGFWLLSDDKRKWTQDVAPWSIVSKVQKPRTIHRTMPLAVNYPANVIHTIEVALPNAWNVLPTNIVVASKFMEFSFRRTYANCVLRLTYQFDTLSDSVPAEQTAEYLQALDRMDHVLNTHIFTPVLGLETSGFRGGGLNWQLILTSTLFTLLMVGGAVWLYRYRSSTPPPSTDGIDPNLRGIAGWLILPGNRCGSESICYRIPVFQASLHVPDGPLDGAHVPSQ